MKKLLAAMFVALLMVGCGDAQEEAIDLNDKGTLDEIIADAIDGDKLQTRYIDGAGTLACEPDEQTPYTGWTKWMYDNGQINELWHYKDGKRNGLTIRWDEDGQKRAEENFKDGKKDGLQFFYSEDGDAKKWSVTYKNGEMVTGSYSSLHPSDNP